jgi:L-rhamnose mutarotase
VIRRAFRMSVHPGQEQEYASRHQPIWKELEDALLDHGVRTYSIYLDRSSNDLFAYVEFEDEAQWNAVATTDVCQRWWRYMQPIMPSHDDSSPVATRLTEVFHLERS